MFIIFTFKLSFVVLDVKILLRDITHNFNPYI